MRNCSSPFSAHQRRVSGPEIFRFVKFPAISCRATSPELHRRTNRSVLEPHIPQLTFLCHPSPPPGCCLPNYPSFHLTSLQTTRHRRKWRTQLHVSDLREARKSPKFRNNSVQVSTEEDPLSLLNHYQYHLVRQQPSIKLFSLIKTPTTKSPFGHMQNHGISSSSSFFSFDSEDQAP